MKTEDLNILTWISKRSAMMTHVYILLAILVTGSCSSETDKKPDDPQPHIHSAEQDDHHDVITVTSKQFSSLGLHLGKVEVKELGSYLKATGHLKVPPQNKAHISSLLNGTVTSISVHEGAHVKKGQELLVITSHDFIALQQELLEVRSELGFAGSDLERKKVLAEKEVAAKKQLELAQREYDVLKAKESALSNRLNALGVDPGSISASNLTTELSLKSPIHGNVAHIEVSIGSQVEASREIMHVIDNSQLHLDLFLFEKDLSKVKVGQTVDLVLTNMDDKPYTARVFGIGSAFEGSSKTIPVHAAITGTKEGLIEGMNVTARVNLETETRTAVPSSAIINSGDEEFIFVLVHDHVSHEHSHQHNDDGEEYQIKMIQVRSGTSNDLFTHISANTEIPEDTEVVTSGGFYLLSMFRGETRDHAH